MSDTSHPGADQPPTSQTPQRSLASQSARQTHPETKPNTKKAQRILLEPHSSSPGNRLASSLSASAGQRQVHVTSETRSKTNFWQTLKTFTNKILYYSFFIAIIAISVMIAIILSSTLDALSSQDKKWSTIQLGVIVLLIIISMVVSFFWGKTGYQWLLAEEQEAPASAANRPGNQPIQSGPETPELQKPWQHKTGEDKQSSTQVEVNTTQEPDRKNPALRNSPPARENDLARSTAQPAPTNPNRPANTEQATPSTPQGPTNRTVPPVAPASKAPIPTRPTVSTGQGPAIRSTVAHSPANIDPAAKLPQTHAPAMQPQTSFSANVDKTDSSALPTIAPEPLVTHVSIYENPLDPPDYDEKNHPHTKWYPSRPEEKNDLGYGWRIIGASRRGYGHAYNGKYREDDFAIKLIPCPTKEHPSCTLTLVALADGVGSKEYSRFGALAAVQGAVNEQHWKREKEQPDQIQQDLAKFVQQVTAREYDEEKCRPLAYDFLYRVMRAAYLGVAQRATQSQEQVGIDDMHSTLLVFLVIPLSKYSLFVASTQIGDGAFFALNRNTDPRPSKRWHWLQMPQIQASGNEVQPFMKSEPKQWEHFFNLEMFLSAKFLMGMTDGTADDIEAPRARAGGPEPDEFINVDDFYQNYLLKQVFTSQHPHADALQDFLGYKKRQSYDDRTVICIYSGSSESE